MLANHIEKKILIGYPNRLTLLDCQLISSGNISLELDQAAQKKMLSSYEFLQSMIDKRVPVYGINTQFGDHVTYLDENLNQASDLYYQSIENRQKNLILSHCSGLGEVQSLESIRVAMALRAHCLSQGYSGVSQTTVSTMLAFLNAGIVPLVRRYGSIGASGDLIPLASIATGLIGGDTEVYYQGEIMNAAKAIACAGLKKLTPHLRDGLAMINGTSFMSALASLAVSDLNRLFKQMLTAIALSLESMQVIQSAYHPLVHRVKGQRGEIEINEMITEVWRGSRLLTDLDELREIKINQENKRPLQDVYSLRSVSQGFGPFIENLKRATEWIENEINSVNDNPIIDVENRKIHHSANFMGYYVTDACDILKMDIAQASSWIHALLANMVHPRKNHGLPTSLISQPEKFNGFRPLQLLAASIAVQNRKLAQSHQAYMLPTEGDNQDVNSLGTHAAIDLQEAVSNLEKLTAILFLAAIQALEFRGIHHASMVGQKMQQKVRKVCAEVGECRPLTDDLNRMIEFLRKEKMS